jgi:hypothetical protein
MNILESEIEDLISENLKTIEGKNLLYRRGLHFVDIYDKFYRQVKLGNYGRLDLAGVRYDYIDRSYNVSVIEIKKDEINTQTMLQAIRYCKGIESMFSKYQVEINFQIFLIGKSVCKNDFCYIPDFIHNVNLYTYKIDLQNGLSFNAQHGYKLTSENLPEPESFRDVYQITKLGIERHNNRMKTF